MPAWPQRLGAAALRGAQARFASCMRERDAPKLFAFDGGQQGTVYVEVWRCRAHEMGYTERKLAVSFPDKTALALGLDVDVVLAHAPVDWASSQEAQLFLD